MMECRAELTDISFTPEGRQRLTFTLTDRRDISEIGDVRLKVTKWHEKRSLSANAYFYVLAGKIAEATAQTLTEVHNQLIADYGQPEIIREAFVPIILKDSINWRRLEGVHLRPTGRRKTLEDGKLYQVYLMRRGSPTYDTREMSRLIDGTIREAEELDIETITPAEKERMVEAWKAS